MTRTRQLYVSILILALVIVYQVMSYDLTGHGQAMPVLVGWVAIVLCVLDVIAHTDTAIGRRIAMVLSGSARQVEEKKHGPALPAELVSFLWLAAACAGVIVFGFLAAVPVYVFAYMVLHGRKGVVQSGLAALGATLFLWLGFEVLLEYQIYRGLLFSDL